MAQSLKIYPLRKSLVLLVLLGDQHVWRKQVSPIFSKFTVIHGLPYVCNDVCISARSGQPHFKSTKKPINSNVTQLQSNMPFESINSTWCTSKRAPTDHLFWQVKLGAQLKMRCTRTTQSLESSDVTKLHCTAGRPKAHSSKWGVHGQRTLSLLYWILPVPQRSQPHPPSVLARRFVGQLPSGSPSNLLIILGIFGAGNQVLTILSNFSFLWTDFGFQKMDWDIFLMAHTNFSRVFQGYLWKLTNLFKIVFFPKTTFKFGANLGSSRNCPGKSEQI